MKSLLIATNNQGKILEISQLLANLDIPILTPSCLGLKLEINEDGNTYAENAMKKAQAFSQASGLPSLADDTGLEVDVLGGEPGLHSNRYGPQPSTDSSRRKYLLAQLEQFHQPWQAKFVATVAIATPEGRSHLTTGVCEGEIIPTERGGGGFGYDPIFFITKLKRTMAELELTEKNQVSHRAKAILNSLGFIRKLLLGNG